MINKKIVIIISIACLMFERSCIKVQESLTKVIFAKRDSLYNSLKAMLRFWNSYMKAMLPKQVQKRLERCQNVVAYNVFFRLEEFS